jgi:hypothetical protein
MTGVAQHPRRHMSVIEWLLDSDPSIRWQVMRDLIAEAVDLVATKRDEHGRWPLENPHPGPVHFEMEGRAGEPSRWNTLRALRVLRWVSPEACP